ncbi:hypothetical protein EMIT0P395_80132 [Pseudomonas sp. IT-P395]
MSENSAPLSTSVGRVPFPQINAFQPVGAAEGCDLLIWLLKHEVKRSQPSAAPTWVFGVHKKGDVLTRHRLHFYRR